MIVYQVPTDLDKFEEARKLNLKAAICFLVFLKLGQELF